MQPTYLPWIGFFDLIDQSDIFVFLDSVQFTRRSWQQRNRIKTSQGELMLTVPVLTKGARDQVIKDARVDFQSGFANDHLKAMRFAYAKSPHFADVFSQLEKVYAQNFTVLGELNMALIRFFCGYLNLGEKKFLKSSDLKVDGTKVDRLVKIAQVVGGTLYLSAAGSKDYIDENNLFNGSGVELSYHQYEHPKYRQLHGEFLPYMSIVDLLFNEGPDSLAIVRQGRGIHA